MFTFTAKETLGHTGFYVSEKGYYYLRVETMVDGEELWVSLGEASTDENGITRLHAYPYKPDEKGADRLTPFHGELTIKT